MDGQINPFLLNPNMTTDQQDQMRRNMMAQALMGSMRTAGQPTSSGLGAMSQGLSPILNAVMLNRMFPQQQQQTPMPMQTGAPAGGTAQLQALQPGNYQYGAGPQASINAVPNVGSPSVGPGMWGNLGNWITRQFSGS